MFIHLFIKLIMLLTNMPNFLADIVLLNVNWNSSKVNRNNYQQNQTLEADKK